MKTKFRLIILFVFTTFLSFAQNEWYASPTGSNSGDGSINNPWDLQTVLTAGNGVQPGDTIWLLDGQYDGRFESTISGNATNKITVSSYPGQWAVLNGNIPLIGNEDPFVLFVKGGYVIFKDFEVTNLGFTTRNLEDPDFYKCNGIDHRDGENCEFINLLIHDNPGTGVASWKKTAGTQFYGCMVYNNGWLQNTSRPNRGPAFYVQNQSDQIRLFENNIVFGNLSHGYEIWSASEFNDNDNPNTAGDFVKNITVDNSTVFNNSLDFTTAQANILISTNDGSGMNVVSNINILNSEVYHNQERAGSGYGQAIRLNEINGEKNALEDITIDNNFLMSRNKSLVIGHVNTLTFTNNLLITGFIKLADNDNNSPFPNWNFDHNQYFIKNGFDFIRFDPETIRLQFNPWQQAPFNKDASSVKYNGGNNSSPIFNLMKDKFVKNRYEHSRYKVVSYNFQKTGTDNIIDFSSEGIAAGTPYKIYDVENYPDAVNPNPNHISGTMATNGEISFPRDLMEFRQPTAYSDYKKTLNNFSVYLIEFERIAVSPKVFLQGALINTTDGLMRDNLRTSGLIPLTSPYGDGLTTTADVFNTVGDNAIVDWVRVELRDGTDTSTIIASTSALLQRDGDVVDIDGQSPVAFSAAAGNYHVSIHHRNHVDIMTADPFNLTTTTTSIDLTSDISLITGSTNAVAEINPGVFAMLSGDIDSNGQVQNTDVSILRLLLGTSGYSNADLDMNGQIQLTDLNNALRINIGRGIQF